jgi:hypothetical protein
MAENKTQSSAKSVPEFLEQIEDPKRKADCKAISVLMEKLSGSKPKMWGDSIVGFGDYRYKYASGREGVWFLYYPDLPEKLGKFKHGKGCLYIKQLEDVDLDVLESLITTSIKRLKET